jgi:hypothetical protein
MNAIRQPAVPARYPGELPGPAAAAVTHVARTAPSIDWAALRTAGRACCCAARPALIALVPPAPNRAHRTDLLLCMHHFRVSRRALAAARASVLDLNGTLVGPDHPGYLTDA